MLEINNFNSLQISLASPEKIREWSHGEVTKSETINYRTQRPEQGGLFCETIFGPTKDYECRCGKYKKGKRFSGRVCEKCGVEITKSRVRRERMGHIELAAPVAHIWYYRGVPSRIGTLLDLQTKQLEKIVYFAAYVVIEKGDNDVGPDVGTVLSESEYADLYETCKKEGKTPCKVGMGAEAIKTLLQKLDISAERDKLKAEIASLKDSQQIKKQRLSKKLDIVNAFYRTGNKPEWMILDVLPVLPADLRPMVPLEGGRYAISDLNELYRRVINRNNRLKGYLEKNSPEIIVRNEKRMVQEAVDALIDNGRHGKAITGAGNRQLKCLSELLKGKTGRFRQNLLGKRVDFSGRSVIVVGPELKMYQCGVPKEMALELFKPFVYRKLLDRGLSPNIKTARKAVERLELPEIWDILEEVIKDHPVLLNRAPTLHRLSVQAYEPVLVEGKAIKLHPLACTAFNADFDGDQMAIHVPLSIEAQAEARILMLMSNNILKLSDGNSVVTPTQDMVLGSYYLTFEKSPKPTDKEEIAKLKLFKDFDEAETAYACKKIKLQDWIRVRRVVQVDGMVYRNIVVTTVGKLIFNKSIPQDLGIYERKTPEDMTELEIQSVVTKKVLGKIVAKCFKVKGATEVSKMLDDIKEQGYKYSTISGITTSVFDMKVSDDKWNIIAEADNAVKDISKKRDRGILDENSAYKSIIKIWEETTKKVADNLKETFEKTGKDNPIWMMADSGARGSMDQIKQLSGMRGLMADPTGKTIEIPVKASFREGLSVLDYFISSHGARKGNSDTALKTADSGYLTRRLVDVSHDTIILSDDCGDKKGIEVTTVYNNDNFRKVKTVADVLGKDIPKLETLEERITGRFSVNDIIVFSEPQIIDKKTGEVISEGDVTVFPGDTLIREDAAKQICVAIEKAQAACGDEGKAYFAIEDGTVEVAKGNGFTDITLTSKDKIFKYHLGSYVETIAVKDGDKIKAGRTLFVYRPGKFPAVNVRSVLACKAKRGVCAKCYGANMASTNPVKIGEAVGVIAAQSIGEPGTQLTMRTFHTGGIASGQDITQGLPRVQEIIEARTPKGRAAIADTDGTIKIILNEKDRVEKIVLVPDNKEEKVREYDVPFTAKNVYVVEKQHVKAGAQLYEGNVDPKDVLRVCKEKAAQDLICREIQIAYRANGVEVNDKHFEVIVRKMLSKVIIKDPGDTDFIAGALVDKVDFKEVNEKVINEGLKPAETYGPHLLGITKAAVGVSSFLSAASFQETTRVLTDAAINNREDKLYGLKENVILGKLIPAGTGLKRYQDIIIEDHNANKSNIVEDNSYQVSGDVDLGYEADDLTLGGSNPLFGMVDDTNQTPDKDLLGGASSAMINDLE